MGRGGRRCGKRGFDMQRMAAEKGGTVRILDDSAGGQANAYLPPDFLM